MKPFISIALIFSIVITASFTRSHSITGASVSPLADYSKEWNDPKYLVCNTAANATFMTPEERKTIYVLNLARMNPVLFANTVVQQYPDKSFGATKRTSTYYQSLLATMKKMKPVQLLLPDSLCYESAFCHAVSTGKKGQVTHDRNPECKSKSYFSGECCHYGNNEALEIIMSLLIDEGIPSLGHRDICLGKAYETIGVSIQPHSIYRHTAVLDFKYIIKF